VSKLPVRQAGRHCPDCKHIVPRGVRICPNCKSFQDWRRYVTLGHTNLALIVALISVATTLVTVVVPLIRQKDAEIKVIFVKSTGNSLTFLARNEGQTGGVLRATFFGIHSNHTEPDGSSIGFWHGTTISTHEAVFLEPLKEQLIDVSMPGTIYDSDEFMCTFIDRHHYLDRFDFSGLSASNEKDHQKLNSEAQRAIDTLVCEILFDRASLATRKNMTVGITCSQLSWVKSCLYRRLYERVGFPAAN
jgi:RNA polymerase subunit RPABC4/transcription elongation factor Spt4